jgi:CRISPR-associated protein Cst1
LAEHCGFCARHATYRANREFMPMINGRDVYNFSPKGQAGFPLCGWCSLALQALPLGCMVTEGTLLAIYSPQPNIMVQLAHKNLAQLQRTLTLNIEKLEGEKNGRTRFVEQLVTWLAQLERRHKTPIQSVTGYMFSNFGTTPRLKILTLDALVMQFLDSVLHPDILRVRQAWERANQRALERAQSKKKKDIPPNPLYEALLGLPDNATAFFYRFIRPIRDWELSILFIERMLLMTPEDIALLKQVGERVVQHAREKRKFLYDWSRTEDFSAWRRAVLRAAEDVQRAHGTTLITHDEFLQLFVWQEGSPTDWRLARDLITLYIFEKLGNTDEAVFNDETTTEIEIEGEV